MTSGRQSRRGPAGVVAHGMTITGLTAAILVIFLLLIAGCGGGSSSSSGPGSGASDGRPKNDGTDAFVVGTVVDSINNQPIVGANVRYGNVVSGTTGTDGSFSLQVGSNAGAKNLFISGSATLPLYDTGNAGGKAYNLRTSGIPIPVLTAAQSYRVGTITVYTSDGPPPPPSI